MKREPVAPAVLLSQIREQVVVLASDVDEQRRWAHECGLPIDELMQSFTDLVPMFFSRLRSEGALRDRDELVLLRLRVYFDEYMRDPKLFRSWDAVASAYQWQRVRELAYDALLTMDDAD